MCEQLENELEWIHEICSGLKAEVHNGGYEADDDSDDTSDRDNGASYLLNRVVTKLHSKSAKVQRRLDLEWTKIGYNSSRLAALRQEEFEAALAEEMAEDLLGIKPRSARRERGTKGCIGRVVAAFKSLIF